MTSLIERLRAERKIWNGGPFVVPQQLGDNVITALEQARILICGYVAENYPNGNIDSAARAWLRLIDGEQEKEG